LGQDEYLDEEARPEWATWVPGVAPYTDPVHLAAAEANEGFTLRNATEAASRVAIMIPMYQEPCGGYVAIGERPPYPQESAANRAAASQDHGLGAGMDLPWSEEVKARGDAFLHMGTGRYPESFCGAGTVPGTILAIAETLKEVEAKAMDHEKVPAADKWVTTLVADGRSRIAQKGDEVREQNLRNLEAIGLYVPLDELYGARPFQHSRLGEALGKPCTVDRSDFNAEAKKDKPRYRVNGHPVYAHLFERTLKFEHMGQSHEMKMMFLLKEYNGGKLDSQLWFFEGVVKYLHHCNEAAAPGRFEIATPLIDAGTIPRLHPYLTGSGQHDEAALLEMRNRRKEFIMPLAKIVDELLDDETIAGTCGAISVAKYWGSYFFESPPTFVKRLTHAPSMVELAQHFEYAMGNLLDKAAESFFGYISVLPGAFSCYKYTALTKTKTFKGKMTRPLDSYFRSITDIKSVNPAVANMILAEDRILCFDLLCYKNYKLKYVPAAQAFTDVPAFLSLLIRQRRRWINGSLFALIYAIWWFGRMQTVPGRWQALMEEGVPRWKAYIIITSDHLFFLCIFLSHLAGAILNIFMASMLYLGFYLILRGHSEAQDDVDGNWPVVVQIGKWVYISCLVLAVVGGLAVKTDEKATSFAGIGFFFCKCGNTAVTASLYGGLTVAFQVLFLPIFYIAYENITSAADGIGLGDLSYSTLLDPGANTCGVTGQEACPTVANAVVGFLCIFGATFAMAFLQLAAEAWHYSAASGWRRSVRYMAHEMVMLVLGFVSYMFLLPAYVNVLMIFAFTNLHDTSWGTKGLDAQGRSADKQESEMKEFRLVALVFWIFLNGGLVVFVTWGWSNLLDVAPLEDPILFLRYQFFVGFGMTAFKVVGSFMSLTGRTLRRWCRCRAKRSTDNEGMKGGQVTAEGPGPSVLGVQMQEWVAQDE